MEQASSDEAKNLHPEPDENPQVLQNAGTDGKVGLNRNAGSINTAPTFQSGSLNAAQGKINYEGGAGNEGRIQNLSGIEGRERYLAEPGGIRELQAGRMGPQRAAYAGTESGERIQSQADYRKSSESEIGKLSRESQAGNGGAPGFNGGVSNLPSVQAGTPGIRLVSSYDLGLPGGAKNDRVGLIQSAYYDAEQKRVTKALEALRRKFNSSVRRNFLIYLSSNVEALKAAGFTDAEILKMKKGEVSKKWQVHHILPLDDSGTNDFSNLVLIINDPYHKALTSYQIVNTKGFEIGVPYLIEWPVFHDPVYYGKGR